jgi:ABC-type bacteriocin/lantibiotic exporter with double-glycine peptidase domain
MNFNLSIKEGDRVSLVGESGCGKSTVMNLLQGLYMPLGGTILIEGVDLK